MYRGGNINAGVADASIGGLHMAYMARTNTSSISLQDTLGEAIRRWLYQVKQNAVKPSSFERLLTSHSLLMKYSLCNVRMMDLSTTDIQTWMNQLVRDHYSYNTIKKAFNLVSAFIKFALGDGLPIRPVHINVSLPSERNVNATSGKRDVEAYNDGEQQRLRKVCEEVDNPAARAVILLLETGMRVGELLALQWEDVQWSRRAVRIHRTLVNPASRRKSYVQNDAKSRTSNRIVPLSAKAMGVITRIYEESGSPSCGLIFRAEHEPGKSIAYNPLAKAVKLLCKTADVPWKGFHVLRHTFATNCYYRGCEIKLLSKLLGHANVTITYNIYIDLYGDALEEMRAIVG